MGTRQCVLSVYIHDSGAFTGASAEHTTQTCREIDYSERLLTNKASADSRRSAASSCCSRTWSEPNCLRHSCTLTAVGLLIRSLSIDDLV